MATRQDLQTLLENTFGMCTVYFQPPESKKMRYPCIVYELSDMQTIYADDRPYVTVKRYQVTVIDRDPDSPIPDKVAEIPTARFNRFFTSDNLNHWVFYMNSQVRR